MDKWADFQALPIRKLWLFLLIVLALTGCNKESDENMVYKIPEDEKFLFGIGDTLSYRCSDGSVNTFQVQDISYGLETGTRSGWLNDYDETYSIETCKIELLCMKDDWSRYLWEDCEEHIIYSLIFDQVIPSWGTFEPHSRINRRCPSLIEPGVAWSPHSEYTLIDTVLDGKEYHHVFTYETHPNLVHQGGQFYCFIWSMNYGIIRFEVLDEGQELTWTITL